MTKFSGAFTLQAQMQNASAGNWARAPGAPTIGTASVASGTSASVTFTPPTDLGIGTITYTATSSPGGITGTGSSSPITVSGLTTGSSYTFTVTATTPGGVSPSSAASNSITMAVQGQQAYTSPGTYTWVAPAGVTSVSVIAVGHGGYGGSRFYCSCTFFPGSGGSGGALAYTNNFSVTPGNSYTVFIGSQTGACSPSSFSSFNSTTVRANGGRSSVQGFANAGGTVANGTGFAGGSTPSVLNSGCGGGGGGGAGGYTAVGGTGGRTNSGGSGTSSTGGGGGGGGAGTNSAWPGAGGGGVGILGAGSNGTGGAASVGGGGGSCGGSGGNATRIGSAGSGGAYGGGGGASWYCANTQQPGGNGAVRIIWPGTTRQFPSTNTGNL